MASSHLNPFAPPYLINHPPLLSTIPFYYHTFQPVFILSVPRAPLSGRRRVTKVSFRSDAGNKLVGAKRWKNRTGNYHKTLPVDSETTSVMIKNIPNRYTRELLMLTLDNHCKRENHKLKSVDASESNISAYDHLYLPIDFKSRVNAGFAFVNFTSPTAAMKFCNAFHGKRWAFSDSAKVAEISKAKIQGKRAIINNFKKMKFVSGSDEDLPVIFEPARDGSGRVHSKMVKLGKHLC